MLSASVTSCVCLCFVSTTFSEEVRTEVGPYDSAVSELWTELANKNGLYFETLSITKLTVI